MSTMARKLILSLVVILILSLRFSLPATAQQTLGSITGIVSDATGAVIQKADITLVNNDTGLSKTAVSKGDGSFFFSDLPIRDGQ